MNRVRQSGNRRNLAVIWRCGGPALPAEGYPPVITAAVTNGSKCGDWVEGPLQEAQER